MAADDKISADVSHMTNHRVVVTEKMDGENTTMTSEYIHARSVDSKHHESRAWVKNFWSSRRHRIPEGWRICGENMFAQHSIPYNNLPGYFMGFSIWNAGNMCLSWDETTVWFEMLDIPAVPVLYDGIYDEEELLALATPEILLGREGYVARTAHRFHFEHFKESVRKYVRKNHVQTDEHWMFRSIIRNGLKK